MNFRFAALLLLAFATPAHADWTKAESENFVVYADDSEDDVRKFAEMLERYHSAMEHILNMQLPTPSPSNRVTIFAVGGEDEIEELTNNKRIAGFYIPRAGGSAAFVQDIRVTTRELDFSMTILLHEYAHHFMMYQSRRAMPRWLGEGAAEFFASARFPKDGSVNVGRPAKHRAGELAYAKDVHVRELLDEKLYLKDKSKRSDAYYGRSWLLYHYLTFSKARAGQLAAYWNAVGSGRPSLKAGEAAFGDLDKLQRELDNYLKSRRMSSFDLSPDMIDAGAVQIQKLSPGHAAMMPVIIRSKRGVNEETAPAVLQDARAVAELHLNDAQVQAALAEAEFDSGNYGKAVAAADRAIAIDPAAKNAYVQKGYALFEMAADSDDLEAAYSAAMEPFSALNAMENDHPIPLMYFYRSFTERGAMPSVEARRALQRAAILTPFDHGLWMQVGILQAQLGGISLAKSSLAPLAANPHGGGLARRAEAVLAALETAEEGVPFDVSQALMAASIAEETADLPQ